ncbi:MAG: hypothetical protein ABSA46_13660 [Thermodesulfovibrionales bacterium]|jgi:hypothetical protein
MDEEPGCNIDIFALLGLKDLKKSPDILPKIKLDVTPRMVMEPRFQSKPEDLEKLKEICGYMFYIESQSEPPALMLMKVGKLDVTSTVGRIDEIPGELLQRAIANPVETPSNGMFAITDDIREWIKKELGL